ncbi:hypothetical protein BQ8794_240330 [Mesorhizobium prunaredense]|uniref:Uncharacterized protein n=1 Tax=Mesorhizobium prunaredense TaxID=1631249 RepID=A0A1R3VA46_9HYPH|nr:hypothetical protein BQ8794_240330 [Mesorhizobium prunaredense]
MHRHRSHGNASWRRIRRPLPCLLNVNLSTSESAVSAVVGHLSGVVAICEVADPVLGLEIGLCLDLTLSLTRSGSFVVSG